MLVYQQWVWESENYVLNPNTWVEVRWWNWTNGIQQNQFLFCRIEIYLGLKSLRGNPLIQESQLYATNVAPNPHPYRNDEMTIVVDTPFQSFKICCYLVHSAIISIAA